MVKCFNCQLDTSNPKFCSRGCAITHNNKNNPKRKRKRRCVSCESLVLSNRQYCDGCFENRSHLWTDRKEANRFYVKESRKRIKFKAVDYKGGSCVVCGYNKCLSALEFHHLEPSEKDFHLSHAATNTWSWDRIKIELDKCVLLCCRCHREIHAGLAILPV